MHDILLPSHRLARLRNATHYPDEAALLARLPLVGRRVPLRAYWRHRPVRPVALSQQLLLSSPLLGGIAEGVRSADLPSGVEGAWRTAEAAAEEGVRRGIKAGRRLPAVAGRASVRLGSDLVDTARERVGSLDLRPPQVVGRDELKHLEHRPARRRRSFALFGATVAGALLMYYFDGTSGRRRRALFGDQLVHLSHLFTRRLPGRVERRARFLRGVARGVRHEAAGVVLNGREDPVDDETLVARVRSEVLRGHDVKAGEIHLDAYEGTVTLRGQLQYPDEIRRLMEDASHVDGVRQVRSYLHLPGTPAPNKAEIYELEHGSAGRGA